MNINKVQQFGFVKSKKYNDQLDNYDDVSTKWTNSSSRISMVSSQSSSSVTQSKKSNNTNKGVFINEVVREWPSWNMTKYKQPPIVVEQTIPDIPLKPVIITNAKSSYTRPQPQAPPKIQYILTQKIPYPSLFTRGQQYYIKYYIDKTKKLVYFYNFYQPYPSKNNPFIQIKHPPTTFTTDPKSNLTSNQNLNQNSNYMPRSTIFVTPLQLALLQINNSNKLFDIVNGMCLIIFHGISRNSFKMNTRKIVINLTPGLKYQLMLLNKCLNHLYCHHHYSALIQIQIILGKCCVY